MNEKPLICVTMGDPAGVGPEITVKVLSKPEVQGFCKPVLIGDLALLSRPGKRSGKRSEKPLLIKGSAGGLIVLPRLSVPRR